MFWTTKLILTLDVEDTGDDTIVLLPVSMVELGIVDEPISLSEEDMLGKADGDVEVKLSLAVSVMLGFLFEEPPVSIAAEESVSVVAGLACDDGLVTESVVLDPELT